MTDISSCMGMIILCTLSMTLNVNSWSAGLYDCFISKWFRLFSEWLCSTKMIELFFALMLCILREIIKNGCDNVFIETGNVFKMTAKSYTLTLKSYRIWWFGIVNTVLRKRCWCLLQSIFQTKISIYFRTVSDTERWWSSTTTSCTKSSSYIKAIESRWERFCLSTWSWSYRQHTPESVTWTSNPSSSTWLPKTRRRTTHPTKKTEIKIQSSFKCW